MSEEEKCEQDNEMLKMICNIEENYKVNFNPQAKLFKDFFDKLNDDNRIDSIKKFIAKETPKTRKEVLSKAITDDTLYEKVLYLGIPGSLGRSYEKVESQVEALVEILKDDSIDTLEELKEQDYIKVNATITSIMYLFFPEKFIPIAGPIQDFLKKIGIDIVAKSWVEYSNILEELKKLDGFKDVKSNDFNPSMTISLSFASWLEENQIDNILNKFIDNDSEKPKNIILTGIPGTGKTYTINEFLKDKKDQYEFVQFHPSYDYEDFIEGLKPVPSHNGQIEFKLVNGIFKELCKKAFQDKDKTYVMVIDEINRANLSRVFGELLYCLEYRDKFVSTKMTTYIRSLDKEKDKLEYSIALEIEDKDKKKIDVVGKFAIPSNLIILGTMNEVDRSIDAFDLALRRRFIWEDVGFDETALRIYKPFFANKFQSNIEDLIKKAKKLNDKLGGDDKNKKDTDLYIGANYKLGHTYYYKIIDYYNGDFQSALCDLWNYHIKSIVREYCKIKFGENEINEKLEKYKKIIVGDENCNE